ncbi:hypothetical protein HRbin41_00307 [bacterium HR41]|nr:hypothetical protein HRbin41_00307 [bacterium HR41]
MGTKQRCLSSLGDDGLGDILDAHRVRAGRYHPGEVGVRADERVTPRRIGISRPARQ